MYLHIGDDFVIPFRDVVGIFDLDNTTTTAAGRKFIRDAEKKGSVITVGDALPKSYIICNNVFGSTIFISPISSSTLLKRAEKLQLNF